MLSKQNYDVATTEIKLLHDPIYNQEKWLLTLMVRDVLPIHAIKVPEEYEDWVHEYPADKFYIRFEEIYDMLHLRRLSGNLVRLWALHLVSAITTDRVRDTAVADPYYMTEGCLKTADGRKKMERSIANFMKNNKDKTLLLVPYFP